MPRPRVLNREALRSAGIEYFPEPEDPNKIFPNTYPQGLLLAQYLLDFEHRITRESYKDLEKGERIRLASEKYCHMLLPRKRPDEKSKRFAAFVDQYDPQDCDRRFDIAWNIKQRVDRINSKDEQRWSEVIEQLVFGRHIQQARRQEGVSKKQKAANVLQRFRVERDHLWEFGREVLQKYAQSSPTELMAPKPDLYFSFHACARNDHEQGPLGADDYVQNFSMTTLSKLYEDYKKLSKKHRGCKFGFIPSPLTPFYSSQGMKHQQCFPWLVCEWKHHGQEGTSYEERMHCQAANGAAVCLTLLANAAATEFSTPEIEDIRPVVCMTFVGSKSKVWIAHVDGVDEEEGRYTYQMDCIWQGSLSSVLDNVMLSIIIDKVHFWAMNHLRPWLSSCIDRWRRMVVTQINLSDSESEDSDIGVEQNNPAYRRAATLDSFIQQREDKNEDDYQDDTEQEDSYDSDSREPSDEESELEEQAEDLIYTLRKTRSASNTPKKNTYQLPSRLKKS